MLKLLKLLLLIVLANIQAILKEKSEKILTFNNSHAASSIDKLAITRAHSIHRITQKCKSTNASHSKCEHIVVPEDKIFQHMWKSATFVAHNASDNDKIPSYMLLLYMEYVNVTLFILLSILMNIFCAYAYGQCTNYCCGFFQY